MMDVFGVGEDMMSFLNFADFQSFETRPYSQEEGFAPLLFYVTILTDGSKNIQKRRVYTILEFFGDVGGLYGILILAFGTLSNFVVAGFFQMSINKNLFLYENLSKKDKR